MSERKRDGARVKGEKRGKGAKGLKGGKRRRGFNGGGQRRVGVPPADSTVWPEQYRGERWKSY